MILNADNYKNGFLVDDEVIAGVTELAGGVFAAYVSQSLTGETLAYQEFDAALPALEFLEGFKTAMNRTWQFEGIGCGTKAAKSCAPTGCSGCSCSTK